jgi:hypothetical protein
VYNSNFSKGNLKIAATRHVQNWFMLHEQRMISMVLVLFIPLCMKWSRNSNFRMKAKIFCIKLSKL